MRLSHHSKLRLTERANIKKQNQKQFFREALNKGKSYGELPEGKLKNYIMERENWNSKIKVYKGYIFIHSKGGKTLYTIYKIPSELLEEEI